MAKDVKKFEISPDYYVIKAVNYEMDGDIVSAMGSVKAALALSNDVYLWLKAAAYYELMERYEQANNIYFRLLAERGDIMHCYYALSDNMFCLGEEQAGVHYLEKYTRLAQSDESREEAASLVYAHMEDLRRGEFRTVPDWATMPETGLLPKIGNLVGEEKYDAAAELAASVPEGAMDYVEAKNAEAACRECLEKFREAELCYRKVLDKEPDNVQALCGMVRTMHLASGGGREYLAQLKERRDLTPEEMRKVCFAVMEYEDDAEALRYFTEYVKNQPYDAEVLHLTGIAAYNLGKYAESFGYFDRARMIDDRYFIEKYYRRIAAAKRDSETQEKLPERFEYRWQLPDGEAERRLKKMRSSLNKLTQESAAQVWADTEFEEALHWAMSLSDNELNYFVIRSLALYRCPQKDAFFDGILMDATADMGMKRHILYCQAVSGGRSKVTAVFSNILKEIRLNRNTEEMPLIFRAAYAMTVSTLAPLASKFERTLSRALTAGVNRYMQCGREFKKPNALAAALTYASKLGGDLSDAKYLSELYSCRYDTLQNYIKTLGY